VSLQFSIDGEFDEIFITNREGSAEIPVRIVGATISVFEATDLANAIWSSTFRSEQHIYNFFPLQTEPVYIVKIDNLLSPYLIHLAEIQVFTGATELTTSSHYMSSTDQNLNVDLTFDGNLATYCHSGHVSGIGPTDVFLQFSVAGPFDQILVTNRPDGSQDRIGGARISVFHEDNLDTAIWVSTFGSTAATYTFLPVPPTYLVKIDFSDVVKTEYIIALMEIRAFDSSGSQVITSQQFLTTTGDSVLVGACFDNDFNSYCHSGYGNAVDYSAGFLSFGVEEEFSSIVITNRAGGEDRIEGATIAVWNTSDTTAPMWSDSFVGAQIPEFTFVQPTVAPTAAPTTAPTVAPTAVPTAAPTASPTAAPTAVPTVVPTAVPTAAQTMSPTAVSTMTQSMAPTAAQVDVESFTSTCDCSACPVFTAALCGAGTGACAAEYGLPNPVCQPGATDFTCVISEDESCDNGESCASNCGLFGCSESHYTCIPNTPSEEHMDGAALCGLVHSTNMHNVANDWTCKGAVPNTPPCGNMEHPPWRGIKCSPDGRVKEVSWQFTDYFVQGHIDSSIRHLTEVVFLDFHHQLLKGPIEAELGNLPKLQYLDLSVNMFTGKLPHTFHQLKEHNVEFKVRGNQLDNHKHHA